MKFDPATADARSHCRVRVNRGTWVEALMSLGGKTQPRPGHPRYTRTFIYTRFFLRVLVARRHLVAPLIGKQKTGTVKRPPRLVAQSGSSGSIGKELVFVNPVKFVTNETLAIRFFM